MTRGSPGGKALTGLNSAEMALCGRMGAPGIQKQGAGGTAAYGRLEGRYGEVTRVGCMKRSIQGIAHHAVCT